MEASVKLLVFAALTLTLTAITGTGGQFPPGPRYSLDNMPKTSFSCRDKILGGYYADSETQCQMFHVCVKVSGIGVQDFRFLCPNGTAFDQEAQICADWGDVDCEAATLYYGSDNFDLYRLGSGFESKRAPFAEEEEATFHLQRAETSDARRSKQFIVNQSSKPQQPPVHSNPNQIPPVQRPQQQQQLQQHHQQQHHHHRQSPVTTTTTTTTTSTTAAPFYSTTENYFNKASNLQYQKQIQQKHQQHKQQQLAYNQQQQIQQQQYRQLTAAAATATPADRSRQAEELRSTTPTSFPSNHQPTQRTSDNSNDEIFRGSHSSHFFNNRNNGKEDFDDDFVRRPAASTTSPTTTARPATPSNTNATRSTQTRGRNRGRGSVRAHNLNIVRSEAKPTPARQQTRLQATTPEDFFDVPKIQNFSRGSANHHNNNNNNNNFRQQPTTVLQPQTDNKINFGQQQQQNQQPASTPAPFSRGQRPTQNAATSRSSNAFFQQQQTNTTPARSIAQQYQTTTPAAQRFQQQQQQVHSTPRPQNFQQQQLVNTTPRPQNFQQFQTTTNVPLNQQRYQPPSTPAAANQHFTDFNNQFFAPNPSTTPPPNINYQFFSRNPSTPVPAQIINRNPTTQAPVQNLNRNPPTQAPAQNFNRVTQAPQFYNTGFENKATERNEPITTPQESQRTRAQSRSFNIDPARLNQFNYNEYQGSRTSTTTSTTTVAPTPAAAVFDFKPSTYNPLSYRQQQQPQQPLRQHPPSFNVNPFDPRSTAASVSITTTTTSTQRPASNNEQRYQTISRSASDNYTPSTIKKFSTLVPKDQYNPTTFKPNALSKKALLQFVIQKPEKQDKIIPPAPVKSTVYVPTVPPVSITTTTTTTQAPVVRKQSQPNNFFQQPQQQPTRPTTTTTTTTTQRPQDIDEDDGQYHPELYEKDFYRNRVKAKFNQERKQHSQDPLTSSRNNFFQQSTPVSQSLSSSDEDEIFRTAHSQNIAASGNDLILERARQAAAKINEFLSSSSVKPTAPAPTKKAHHHQSKDANQRVNPRPFSKAPTIPPNATSTKRPADDKEEYDYAYYDTGSPDVPEYDVIEDFGRTSAHKKNKKN